MRIDPDTLATAIAAAIQAAYDPLAARIAVLEQRPTGGVKWAGIHEPDRVYAEGDLCTRGGSLWLALHATAATPGHDPTCWKLICKQSR